MEYQLPDHLILLVPAIAFIVQLVKETGYLDQVKGLCRLLALILGITFSYCSVPELTTWYSPIIPGIMMGIMSIGGYEAFKIARKGSIRT